MAEGIQIVSDGTVEGTRVLLDGHSVEGRTEATWRFNARSRTAQLVLSLSDIKVDFNSPVDTGVSQVLSRMTD